MGAAQRRAVAGRAPGKKAIAVNEIGLRAPPSAKRTNAPSGSARELGAVGDFPPLRADPLGMQRHVHLGRPGRCGPAARLGPQRRKALGIAAAALEAGAMAGGQRRRLVEEEQLGVAVGLHHRLAVPALELEHAGDPLPGGPAAGPERPVGQMEGAAAVAHHEAAVRRGDDLALGRDAVLERHRAICQTRRQITRRRECPTRPCM